MKRNLKRTLGIVASSVVLASSVAGRFLPVNALSSALTTTKTEVAVGESFKASVTLRDVASWNVHVWATGPVDGCTIDNANVSDDANNIAEKTFETDCVANGVGSIVLTLFGEITNEEQIEARLSGASTITVTAPAEEPAREEPVESEPLPIDTPAEAPARPSSEPSADIPSSVTTPVIVAETTGGAEEQSSTEGEEAENEADELEDQADTKNEEEESVTEKKEEGSSKRTMVVASGSTTDDRTKSALVVALAVVATMVGCIEVYVILSSHRKERLQKLREKAQTLHVATTTMQLARAMEKK